ncbi:MAG: hypothetical protein N2504_02510 [candidate division WOR-3 bacterium]|nr:hypothetical protein [candidate division WOR-3 bacterium]MCX7947447.1 hypothetical protein [candidate division WOR-3 bacterium]MDW8150607.1 hypothetical protein [candidate division WOR-3 bacterium]
MFVFITLQQTLMSPSITIKDAPKNKWIYNKDYIASPINWSYSQSTNEKVFGSPYFFKGNCQSASEKTITNEICEFYYASDIYELSENHLKFYIKGKGKFRISVNSSKGHISQEVNLNDEWQEIIIDLSKSVHITQHGSKFKPNLKVVFSPLTQNFEIYISSFILE